MRRNGRLNSALAVFACRFLRFGEGLLRSFVRLVRILHGLPRMFMPGQVILPSVMGSRRAVRMRRHLVEFRCSGVISIWHGALLLRNYEIRIPRKFAGGTRALLLQVR